MRTNHVQICVAIAVGGALASLSTAASAATPSTPNEPAPSGFNTPPAGPGTEHQEPGRPGVRPGLEGGVGLGTGFSSTYGIGMEARLGYTMPDGIYGGAALQ